MAPTTLAPDLRTDALLPRKWPAGEAQGEICDGTTDLSVDDARALGDRLSDHVRFNERALSRPSNGAFPRTSSETSEE